MREPWATLFAGYGDHWLLGQYLTGDEPDWDGIDDNRRLTNLSSGELALLQVAREFRPFKGVIRSLDRPHRERIARALVELP